MKTPKTRQDAEATSAKPQKRLMVTRLSEVSAEGQDWFWKDRIARGGLTIVGGEPGDGKTTILISLAACSTVGGQLPNDEGRAPPGFWFYVTTENDTARTIKPRFVAAGGDPHQLAVIKGTEVKGRTLAQRGLDLEQDIAELEELIKNGSTDQDCIGIVFDPINEYLGAKVDSWKEADVRRVLGPLAALAERQQVAVIGIMHSRKAESSTMMNKMSGSKSFMAQARCASFCLRDNEQEDKEDAAERFVFIPIKNNLGRKPNGLLYMFEDVKYQPSKGDDPELAAEVGMMPKVCWLGPTDKTAEELCASSGGKEDKGDKISDAILLTLQELSTGPKSAAHMDRVRDGAAISDSSWRRARKKMMEAGRIVMEGIGNDITWRQSDEKPPF